MRIGFDAKRAFQNNTGLGNYSRTLIQSLCSFYPGNDYFLYAPKFTTQFQIQSHSNAFIVTPTTFPFTFFRSAWRSVAIKNELIKNNIDLFHGLSHEIPLGIQHSGVKSVVTIHDLIFERFPKQHSAIDVWIYRKKFKNACKYADAVIAISEQTKTDLVNLYNVPSEKITVCYQSCSSIFNSQISTAEKEKIRTHYKLPSRFFLSVGSIIERKNLLTVCKAIHLLKEEMNIPLVVIGNGGKYKKLVLEFLAKNKITDSVIFLSDTEEAKNQSGYKNASHFPAIYQMAEALIYPSMFEGFGIPILEALQSRLPVITSNVSSMPEAGGDAAAYIEPFDYIALAQKMKEITNDLKLRESMQEKGLFHAQSFTTALTAAKVMNVYKQLMPAISA